MSVSLLVLLSLILKLCLQNSIATLANFDAYDPPCCLRLAESGHCSHGYDDAGCMLIDWVGEQIYMAGVERYGQVVMKHLLRRHAWNTVIVLIEDVEELDASAALASLLAEPSRYDETE